MNYACTHALWIVDYLSKDSEQAHTIRGWQLHGGFMGMWQISGIERDCQL